MNNLLKLLTVALVASVAYSCGSTDAMSEFQTIDDRAWAYGDTIFFDVCRADSTAPVNIVVALRHDGDYEWSNLWLEVTAPAGDGSVVRDTLNLTLADLYGRWLGKGFGSSYQVDTILPRRLTPPNGAKIAVRHIMRLDTLRGIERIGISLRE